MESWRKVWREGVVHQISTNGLKALGRALAEDDGSLMQEATTSPPPLQCMQDCPVEGACLVAYGAWQGDGKETVGEVEEAFAKVCFEADLKLGEPAAIRWLLNWWDDSPREEALALMLAEVVRELKDRGDDCDTPSVVSRTHG
jgi:hypothetical protein